MKRLAHKYFIPQKLAQKFVLWTVPIIVFVGLVSGLIQMRTHEEELLDTIIIGADQLSNGITAATWHAMLADNREAAYRIMETIARRQGIDNIRIFNREGRIMFSTIPSDTGLVSPEQAECAICHVGNETILDPDPHSRARMFETADGLRELAMVTPIYNEPACSDAECHAHPASVRKLGVLDVTYSLADVDQVIAGVQRRAVLLTSGAVVLIGIFMFVFVRATIHKPIRKLIEGTRTVSAMQLDRPLAIQAEGELGELADSFELMRQRLQQAVRELNELTRDLDAKVRGRTAELNAINQRLYQSDRLSSLGQLAASVAHEINNPVAGVLNLSMLLQRIIDERGIPAERVHEVRGYLTQIVSETSRVGRIVTDLLTFSRRPSPQRTETDLNVVLRRTLSIIDHKLSLMGVELAVHAGSQLPPVKCDASQMQQVIVNLVLNAAEAAQSRPGARVQVATRHLAKQSSVELEVSDNGEGIPKEHLGKIFDPFFTTKGEGKGTGLGLAVVYGIVNSHGGEVLVDSVPGEGSTFRVILPLDPGSQPGPEA